MYQMVEKCQILSAIEGVAHVTCEDGDGRHELPHGDVGGLIVLGEPGQPAHPGPARHAESGSEHLAV